MGASDPGVAMTSDTAAAITVSDLAVTKVREVLAQQGLAEHESNLRVFVSGGSCCGPAFGLAFDQAHDDDARIEAGGLSIVIDPMSLPYLQGATIDFVDTAEVQGFKVSVPQTGGGCSPDACGPESCGPSPSGGCSSGACG